MYSLHGSKRHILPRTVQLRSEVQNKPTFFFLAVVLLLIHVILCAIPAAVDNTDFSLERNHSNRCSPVETVFPQLVLGIEITVSLSVSLLVF